MTNLPTTRRKRGTSAFASVDNVDKGSPHAVVTADGKPRSVHGTSYQVVFPRPTQNVDFGEDYVSCSTPQSPQDCGTLKAIKLPHDCKNLYKVLECRNDPTLRNCQRDSNGVPTSTFDEELETVLSQYYKAELVNIISDNKLDAFMDEVGELLPMECQDMTARVELLKKESTTPAEVEASAVAFAAKCPVQIFRLGSEGRFFYKEFGTCFLGVEPLQLLQDATGFDILLSDELASSTTNLTGDSQLPNFEVFRAWRDRNASLLGNEKVALPISVALHAGQVEDNTSPEDLRYPPKRRKTTVSGIDSASTSTPSQYTPARRTILPQTEHALSDFELQPNEESEEKTATEKLTSLIFNKAVTSPATTRSFKETLLQSKP